MKQITIRRSQENEEKPIDMQVIIDNKEIPCILKKEDKEVTFKLSSSEHTIQVGFVFRDKEYRSNAFFYLGKKDTVLFMKKSSSRISLTIEGK